MALSAVRHTKSLYQDQGTYPIHKVLKRAEGASKEMNLCQCPQLWQKGYTILLSNVAAFPLLASVCY